MDDIEQQAERERLRHTLARLRIQIAAAENQVQTARENLNKSLDGYWDSYGGNFWDEAQFADSVNRERSITATLSQGVKRLHRALLSPYFGRIDFAETSPVPGGIEQIYIGITTLTDPETGELLTYDWRAPVSGMFYDFERGEAWYECPAGRIAGMISLKRQYKIADGKMIYLFDSDLKIDDEILQEILSKNADNKMHSIVNSIQREQNLAIRDEAHRVLMVQGPAGSGKTSIALHRAAFLLYRDREEITSKNILILSPNHIFSEYISNVLPEMGEENVLQTTFHDYVEAMHPPIRVETRSEHLEKLMIYHANRDSASKSGIAYKSSASFAAWLEEYIDFFDLRLVDTYPEFTFRGRMLFSRQDWNTYYYQEFSFLPPFRRLAKINELVRLRLRPLVLEVRAEKEAEIVAKGEEINQKLIKALARVAAHEETAAVIDQLNRLTSLNSLSLYTKLFQSNGSRLPIGAPANPPPNWKTICRETRMALEGGIMPHEDSFPFLYFQGRMEGFQKRSAIRHLVIDEAQDYTQLQYKILREIFPGCTWTILGDPAQAVHPYLKTSPIEDAAKLLGIENALSIRLTHSYRSTQEIQDFCDALLHRAEPAQPVNRSGPLPATFALANPIEWSHRCCQAVRSLQDEGMRSIAIICKSAQEVKDLSQQLGDKLDYYMITDETSSFQTGVVILPTYLAKGLEFDAVIIADAVGRLYETEGDRHILYTACTRALHRLLLFHIGELSPLIQSISPSLYTH